MFTDGNKNNHPCSNILSYVYIYIGTSPFSLIGNQTVHEDSYKVRGLF